uniref:Uncharacterized protein n=2 Tax=Physcomitrium patens TaxID=3218 RepID=A0A2K1L116_PHYPA|nr:hypothetical protein PHYPA_002509 [Physcomitrium patens]
MTNTGTTSSRLAGCAPSCFCFCFSLLLSFLLQTPPLSHASSKPDGVVLSVVVFPPLTYSTAAALLRLTTTTTLLVLLSACTSLSALLCSALPVPPPLSS